MFLQVFYLILFSSLLACGQICFKMAANHLNANSDLPIAQALLTNNWLWGAFILYGFSTLLWVYILRVIPLSFAYPFVALGFIIVPAASWYFFSEQINNWYMIGAGFIIFGLLIITLKSQV